MAKPITKRPKVLTPSERRVAPPQCPPELTDQIIEQARKISNATHCLEINKTESATKAVWLRAQGMTYKAIHQQTGIAMESLRKLFWRQGDTIETHRKRFSQHYAQLAEMAGEVLGEKLQRMMDNPEQLDNVSPDRLALTVGIMTDHSSKLAGMPDTVIEHRKGASLSDAQEAIDAARKRIAEKAKESAIEAEVVE